MAAYKIVQLDDERDIIARSPLIQGEHETPHRFVIRNESGVFIVQLQYHDHGKRVWYGMSNYFPEKEYGSPENALASAWACFDRRVRKELVVPFCESV